MTRSTRIYGKVALLMAGILAASVLLTLAVGVDRRFSRCHGCCRC